MKKREYTCRAIWDRGTWVQAVMVLAVLLVCSFYIAMQMRTADRNMRNQLLARTRLMAEAVNPERVKALSGTIGDLNIPAYQQIKTQLILLKKHNADIRFIYLMGFRPDGKIFFFVDSEPPNSPDCSPPGEIYIPGSDIILEALKKGNELVEGPIADQWGVWVSAFVPVEDVITGETVTLLGADMDARIWHKRVLLAGLPGFMLLLILNGIMLIWIWFSRQWRQPGMRGAKWLNRLDLYGVLAIGATLSLFIPWRIYLQEENNRQQFFQQLATSETAQIARNLKSIRSSDLEALASFFYQGDIIHKDDFFHYTRYLIENPLVYFWLWAPAVPVAEAGAFEARIRQEEHPDFRIHSAVGDEPDPTREQNTLFPVIFVEPGDRNQQVLGFNLGSELKRQTAIHMAIRRRMPIATEPVHLLADPQKEKIIVVYRPVFSPKQEDILKGIAAIVLRLSSIQSRSESKKNLIHIDLSMLMDQKLPELLSNHQHPESQHQQSQIQRYLFAFGKVFVLSAVPGKEFLRKYPLWRHGVAMLACFALTAAAGVIVSLISRRRSELENLVRERTLKLTESEFRFRQLSTHSRSLIWDIDERGCFTFVNEVSQVLLGYTPEEMIGHMYFYDLYPAEYRQVSKQQLMALFHSQKLPSRLEQQLATKQGNPVWVSSRSIPLFKADGSLAGYRGQSTDISMRKKAEQERERQTRFQKILTLIAAKYINLPLPQIDEAIDQSLAELGVFLEVDRFYVFEYDPENQFCSNTHEWCAHGVSSQISRLQKIPLAAIPWWVDTISKGEVLNIPDVKMLPPGDSVRKILESQGVQSLLCVPLLGDDRCWGFVGFDSVQKTHTYSEEEARLLEVFAQMLINVRGRIRTETELEQSQELAFAASQAKSDFLTRMSHEIRTPLNGVIGVAELLRETCLDNEQRRLVEIVSSSGKLLLELVNDILDFARIEAGKLELQNSEFDLDELLKSLTASLTFNARAKNVELILVVSPQVPARLCGDTRRLQQVIMNLAGNAVKFTDQGEIAISVEMETESADALVVRFTVSDTGIGIPKDQQPFLFDAFFQADSSIQRKYGGTGLGLPITRGLIENMGGTLSFKSEPGKGSEFTFAIPLQRVPEKPPPASMEADWQNAHRSLSSAEAELPSPLAEQSPHWVERNLEILLAEDNLTNQKVMTLLLKKLGLKVDIAVNGLEALEKLEKKKYDAVLMDVQMPDLDGLEATQRIRDLKRPGLCHQVPIIAVTAHAIEGYREICQQAGMDDYISKPVTLKRLRDVLHRWLPPIS